MSVGLQNPCPRCGVLFQEGDVLEAYIARDLIYHLPSGAEVPSVVALFRHRGCGGEVMDVNHERP